VKSPAVEAVRPRARTALVFGGSYEQARALAAGHGWGVSWRHVRSSADISWHESVPVTDARDVEVFLCGPDWWARPSARRLVVWAARLHAAGARVVLAAA